MNRLQSEWRRLYLARDADDPQADAGAAGLIAPDGSVRAMVLELARPADWNALAPLWQGVQLELELPAPAIAVNGHDGYQLWFSLAQAVPAARARDFLEALAQRYLPEVAATRLALLPEPDACADLEPDAVTDAVERSDADRDRALHRCDGRHHHCTGGGPCPASQAPAWTGPSGCRLPSASGRHREG